MVSLKTILILLVAYQLKHWLCDYRFQTPYMLGKFKPEGWLGPLAAHAGAHAFGTFLLGSAVMVWEVSQGLAPAAYFPSLADNMAANFPRLAFCLAALDFVVHFVVDRVKVVTGRGLDATQPRFWRQLGADQAAHHLTHYAIIAILVTR